MRLGHSSDKRKERDPIVAPFQAHQPESQPSVSGLLSEGVSLDNNQLYQRRISALARAFVVCNWHLVLSIQAV